MGQIRASQELASRFNEDEAVWRRFECLRKLRLLLKIESVLPADVLDEIDWIEAERKVRQVRCVGIGLSVGKPD